MIDISDSFASNLLAGRNLTAKLIIALTNSTLTIPASDILIDGINTTDAVSGRSSFDVGSAIVNSATFKINNRDDKYSSYDFDGKPILLMIGSIVSGATEWITKGTYLIDSASYLSGNLILDCLDYMSKLDYYTLADAGVTLPATLLSIFQAVCTQCGITTSISTFANASMQVSSIDTSKISCREAMSYIAQIAGKNARMSNTGELEFKWYNNLLKETNYDGGSFDTGTPYDSGALLTGGSFDGGAPYGSGDTASGGTNIATHNYHSIYQSNSEDIGADDVVITGINVTAQGTTSDYGESYLYGVAGYVLNITNPFIEEGNAQTVATAIGPDIVGMRFRPMSLVCPSNPSIEACDVAKVTDYKGNVYNIAITGVDYSLTDTNDIKCSAETPTHNSSARMSAATKAYIESVKKAENKLTSYDMAVQRLTSLITQSFGAFKSEEAQEDGSTIYFMHNKPTRAASSIIWKMTANAFAVSTDGGQTWNAGMDAQGNAVMNVLNVVGLNADWINAGTLSGRRIVNQGTVTKYASDYTQTDVDRVQGIILGTYTATLDDFEKYDFNGDAYINSLDLLVCQKLSLGTIQSHSRTTETVIEPATANKLIYTHDTSNTDGVYVGCSGIHAPNAQFNSIRLDDIDVWDSTNNVYTNTASGEVTISGHTIRVKNGLITYIS